MDTQVWIEFLKQNWLVIAIALIILFIVLNVVRTVIKWALAVLIIGDCWCTAEFPWTKSARL